MLPHILLVEDDPTALRLLAAVLEREGYQVALAPDGETALHILRTSPFDLVLTDIQMGEIDGIAVLKAAKSQPTHPEVIIMTGYGTLETAVAALRMGAYDYLSKPCDPAELLTCVRKALEERTATLTRDNVLQMITQGIEQLRDQTVVPARPTNSNSQPDRAAEAGRYLDIGELRIDTFRYTALFQGNPLHITPTEYTLLQCLATTHGRVLSFREIVQHTHGHAVDDTEAQELLKPHIRRLRRKIDPAYLVNVRGIGYMLVEPAETAP